jgi:hypothetical protein
LSLGDDTEVRLVVPEEAALLIGLIRRLHSIGAFTDAGELIGHMGTTSRAHGGITADAGMTLVDPAFRGMDTPAAGARPSSLIRWLPFGLAPERAVYVPERYRAPIEALYAEAQLSRTALQPDVGLGEQASELEHAYDVRRQILCIAVTRAGCDLAAKVENHRRGAVKRGGLVVHVDLALFDPATPAATEALRTHGFSFAGLLPEYREGDVLRLQWLANSVDDTAVSVLSTQATQAIAALVTKDRPRFGRDVDN